MHCFFFNIFFWNIIFCFCSIVHPAGKIIHLQQFFFQVIHLVGQDLLVEIYHLARRALSHIMALIQKHHPVTVFDDTAHIMGNHKNGGSVLSDFLHAAVALGLEEHVSHRKCLIHNQDFRLYINRQRKSQPHKHTAGIGFHRLVNEISNVGKLQNIREFFIHLLFGEAHHGSVHIDILNAGVIHVEARSQLQKRRDDSAHPDLTAGWRQHSGDDF